MIHFIFMLVGVFAWYVFPVHMGVQSEVKAQRPPIGNRPTGPVTNLNWQLCPSENGTNRNIAGSLVFVQGHVTGVDLSGRLCCSATINSPSYPICTPNAFDQGINLSACLVQDVPGGVVDWTGATAIGTVMGVVDLSNAELSGVDFRYAFLSFDNLTSANLSGADFAFAVLTGAQLGGANLTGVNWQCTICPDGTNSATNGADSCIGHL